MQTSEEMNCDVLVAGSGIAGMSAAITAAHHGLKVIVVEKADQFGGTTACSGGWLWIPNSSLAKEQDINESPGSVETYVKGEAGAHYDAERFETFLKRGPEAIDFFTRNTAVQFDIAPAYPDYHPEALGASKGGRSMSTKPFDGLELGPNLKRLAPPLPELMVFGMMLGSGKEIWHFLRAFKSLESFVFVTRLLLSNLMDVLRYGRSMRLTNGNALVGRLMKSAEGLNIEMLHAAPVKKLIVENDRVTGAVIERDGRRQSIKAKRGVVLACGGFSHDVERRKALYPHTPTGVEHYSPVPVTNTGDGQRMAEAVGGQFNANLDQPAAWVPVSLVPRGDGSRGVMPHFIDRAKPGVIAVTSHGKRFANESNSYHDFVQGIISSSAGQKEAFAWLVCDQTALRSYGLGRVAAFPMPIGRHLRTGYLKRGNTLPELAQAIGVDSTTLQATVDEFNRHAAKGEDPVFGKGSSLYNRFMGDPRNKPNPCLRPLNRGPYYAVKLVVGDVGTFAGLETDTHGRVLNAGRHPISGLYAVGGDAATVMGGTYPGAGITLGPGLTFGYLAGLHLADIE